MNKITPLADAKWQISVVQTAFGWEWEAYTEYDIGLDQQPGGSYFPSEANAETIQDCVAHWKEFAELNGFKHYLIEQSVYDHPTYFESPQTKMF